MIRNATKKFAKSFYNMSNKRFSGFNSNSGSGFANKAMLGLFGFSSLGLSFLCYKSWTHRSSQTKALLSSQESFSSDIVNERTKSTLVYFSSGLALTAGLTAMMAKSGRLLRLSNNPFLSFGLIIPNMYFIYKIGSTPVSDPMKPAYFLAFNSLMAFNLAPFAAYMPIVVLKDAGILTSGIFGGLGLVAVNSRDDAFLGMSGILGAGLGGMIALSFANIFLNSPVIFNIWLYGGLALFTGFALYDIKQVQIRAKKQANFDPMWNSIHMYLDFINLFIRLAYILNGRKNK